MPLKSASETSLPAVFTSLKAGAALPGGAALALENDQRCRRDRRGSAGAEDDRKTFTLEMPILLLPAG